MNWGIVIESQFEGDLQMDESIKLFKKNLNRYTNFLKDKCVMRKN